MNSRFTEWSTPLLSIRCALHDDWSVSIGRKTSWQKTALSRWDAHAVEGWEWRILKIVCCSYQSSSKKQTWRFSLPTARNRKTFGLLSRQQRRRQRAVRYHILRRKYVAHPNDVQVNVFVKNHMQFLHKNYPRMEIEWLIRLSVQCLFLVDRWTVSMLSESFNQSIDNVRLILRQRTTRRMRVRPRPPTSLFGIEDEDERERLVREQIIKRDLRKTGSAGSNDNNDDEPVDHRVLAEESHLIARRRPSDQYMEREVSQRRFRNTRNKTKNANLSGYVMFLQISASCNRMPREGYPISFKWFQFEWGSNFEWMDISLDLQGQLLGRIRVVVDLTSSWALCIVSRIVPPWTSDTPVDCWSAKWQLHCSTHGFRFDLKVSRSLYRTMASSPMSFHPLIKINITSVTHPWSGSSLRRHPRYSIVWINSVPHVI